MRTENIFTLSTSLPKPTVRNSSGIALHRYGRRFLYGNIRRGLTVKELDSETGLYYYGARYLDPKTSRWLGCDPALGEYIPSAPASDEARKRNQSLPGQGGVFNYVNLHAYHYAGNNPVKYTDPDGDALCIPLIIIGAIVITAVFRSDVSSPPPEVNISKTMSRLGSTNYGTPKHNVPTLRNAHSRNLETRDRIRIGNSVLTAAGASLPTGGLTTNYYDDGRSGRRKTAMDALGLTGDIAGRLRNSDGYFAGDIIFEVYKTDGKVTNWVLKEAYTLADGSQGYTEYRQDEALRYIEENKTYLNEVGLLGEINRVLNL